MTVAGDPSLPLVRRSPLRRRDENGEPFQGGVSSPLQEGGRVPKIREHRATVRCLFYCQGRSWLMEFFHEPKIDWMGKKWFFIGISIPLLLAGLISMVVKGGLVYGIDFRGGTLVNVKFAAQPNLDEVRAQLERQNLRGETLQQYGPAAEHEVMIGLDLKSTSSAALDAGKQAIRKALAALYGEPPAGKVDFNNASAATVAANLTAADPLQLASQGGDAEKTYRDLADAMASFRNNPPQR